MPGFDPDILRPEEEHGGFRPDDSDDETFYAETLIQQQQKEETTSASEESETEPDVPVAAAGGVGAAIETESSSSSVAEPLPETTAEAVSQSEPEATIDPSDQGTAEEQTSELVKEEVEEHELEAAETSASRMEAAEEVAEEVASAETEITAEVPSVSEVSESVQGIEEETFEQQKTPEEAEIEQLIQEELQRTQKQHQELRQKLAKEEELPVVEQPVEEETLSEGESIDLEGLTEVSRPVDQVGQEAAEKVRVEWDDIEGEEQGELEVSEETDRKKRLIPLIVGGVLLMLGLAGAIYWLMGPGASSAVDTVAIEQRPAKPLKQTEVLEPQETELTQQQAAIASEDRTDTAAKEVLAANRPMPEAEIQRDTEASERSGQSNFPSTISQEPETTTQAERSTASPVERHTEPVEREPVEHRQPERRKTELLEDSKRSLAPSEQKPVVERSRKAEERVTERSQGSKVIAVPPTRTMVKPQYLVQVYATTSLEDAKRWVERLRAMGISSVMVQTYEIGDQLWYRVRFGPFSSRREAEEIVRKHRFSQVWIVRIR